MTHITKCRLCDPQGKPFQISELNFEPDGAALNGQVPQRLTEFNLKLLAHIQKGAQWEQEQIRRAMKSFEKKGGAQPDLSQARHLAAWNQFLAMQALAQGLGILSAYETTDPGLNNMREIARWRLHEMTRRTFMTDEMLLDGLVQLNLDPPVQDLILRFVKQLRDALCERGQFAPNAQPVPEPEPTGLIV